MKSPTKYKFSSLSLTNSCEVNVKYRNIQQAEVPWKTNIYAHGPKWKQALLSSSSLHKTFYNLITLTHNKITNRMLYWL